MSEHDGHIELERRVDSIIVGVRHRQHPEDGIEPLMMSIQKLGLLQPVTITPDGVLVCGARRLEAVKRLGWRTLKVWVRSGISDELHNHYALAYSPAKPPDGLWRTIEVRLKRKDAQIRVRKGYFAVKRRPRSSPAPSGS